MASIDQTDLDLVVPNTNGKGVHSTIKLSEFVASWIQWQCLHLDCDENAALDTLMPHGKINAGIALIVNLPSTSIARKGLDLMVRLILGPGNYNTRWVTGRFLEENDKCFVSGNVVIGKHGERVGAVKLTDGVKEPLNNPHLI